MKRFKIYALGALSLVSLGFIGCESAVIEDEVTHKKEEVKIETVTVTANQSSSSTKVAIADGWKMVWEDGEQLAGYSVDYDNYLYADPSDWFPTDYSALKKFDALSVSSDGKSASFKGDKVSGCDLRLVYPYDESKGPSNFGMDYKIELDGVEVDPTADDAYASAKAGMCMVSSATDVEDGEGFDMKHVTSYVEWIIANTASKAIDITSIVLAPSAGSSVKIITDAKLDLSKEYGSYGFYSEGSRGENKYVVTFPESTPLVVASDAKESIFTSILPFTFTNEESIDVTIYFNCEGESSFTTITKTNHTGSDIVFDAGEYNKIACEVSDDDVVTVEAATVTATVPEADIKINGASLSVSSENAVEIGYVIEESEKFAGVAVDAEYVVGHKDSSAVPEGGVTFTEVYVFDLKWLSPGVEYTVYAYAKDLADNVVITEPIVFNAAALPAMSITGDEVTTTSVTFTPDYQDDYFGTIAYDCFLAESEAGHTNNSIIGDTSAKRIFNNSKDPITIGDLEPETEYIVRLVGSRKEGYNTYYTSADLKFTTEKLADATELASEQEFNKVSLTTSSYNRSTLVFENDNYQVEFDFKYETFYGPYLKAGDYKLFDGLIRNLSDGSEISCNEDSELTVEYTGGKYSFMGKMLTEKISKPAADTDNKYLDFYCFDYVLDFPIDIVESKALSIPKESAYSFFLKDGAYGSDFGLYLVLDDELTPATKEVYSADGSYIQRYQAGAGNKIVEGECIYDLALLMFEVAYDADNNIYTLTNGVGEITDGYGFSIEEKLIIDPTNVVATEVAVAFTEITAASGESEGSGSGWDETWKSEYNLTFASAEFDLFSINICTDEEEDSSSVFPELDSEDGEGYYDDIDNVTINCVVGENTLAIKNSEIVKVEKSGDNYSITIKFESTSNNTIYTATYNGLMYSGYSCEINDYTGSDGGGWGW